MRILYYPGCTVKATALRDEKASLQVLRVLGIEPIEVENWICCGATYNLPKDTVIQAVAPIRTLIRSELTMKK
ncbi:MAG: heterodisulfide reductase-related iron-sulfur binding cluster, partial [Crenarchaeota archaeon]|nr:heterodisulfide reductase-related iron-sulfur binding cluster [Thermoproteota archaeon]